jgi:hypothetical protein
MAREATKIELFGANDYGDQVRYTCASGTAIAKGTILKFATPRTASASTGTGDYVAGIASMDKKVDDYSTSISSWTNGIFLCTASQAVTAGDLLKTAAPGNYVTPITANTSSQAVVFGVALESAADGATVAVRVKL